MFQYFMILFMTAGEEKEDVEGRGERRCRGGEEKEGVGEERRKRV